MKFTNAEEGSKEYRSMIRWCSTFATIIVCILLLMSKDFFTDLLSDKHSYEVKLVKEETLGNGQDAYRLFKDGYEIRDVDYNEYFSLDDNGNTDFKYCALVNDAGNLTFSIILGIMLILVIMIISSTAKGTPFTNENVKRIRAISILQLLLGILPGIVKLLMRFFKFSYYSGHFEIGSMYMFIIAFIIGMIAMVFNYGVKLQEDSDSIA